MIAFRGVGKQYKNGPLVQEVLRDVNLDIESGSFVALMGPSGSGKTTLLNLLGGLDRVVRIVKVTGFVASAPGFTQQPAVINGASNLLVDVFGEHGKHARSAVGVAALPLGSPVEVELVAQFR